MAELSTRAEKYMSLEDFIQSRKSHDDRRREEEDADNRDLRRKKAKINDSSRTQAEQRPQLSNKFRDYANFTPLNTRPERILALRREKFQDPAPIKVSTHRDITKYCAFHKDHGHLTSDCRHLRRQIEDLIQKGELKEFIIEMINDANAPTGQPTAAARKENTGLNADLHVVT